MKQQITREQLNSLSDNGKKRLWEWCQETGYECQYSGMVGEPMEMNRPLFTIGEMIEFLFALSMIACESVSIVGKTTFCL